MFNYFIFTLEVHVHYTTYNEVGLQYAQRNYAANDGKEKFVYCYYYFKIILLLK